MDNKIGVSGFLITCLALMSCSDSQSTCTPVPGALGVVLEEVAPHLNDIGTLVINQHAEGERPITALIEVTLDGLLDDSIRSEKMSFYLSRRENEWSISSKRVQYRCWNGRGHTDFSEKPCH